MIIKFRFLKFCITLCKFEECVKMIIQTKSSKELSIDGHNSQRSVNVIYIYWKYLV